MDVDILLKLQKVRVDLFFFLSFFLLLLLLLLGI